MRSFPVAILLFAACLALTSAPLAEPAETETVSEDAKREAGEHFQRGVELYHAGDYRAALIAFKRAHEIAPNWGVLYNLGQASAELKDYVSALDAFERYLKQGGDAVPADRRKEVEAEIDKLRGYVASLSLAVNVEGAEVLVDDLLVGKTPLGRALVVSAGRRKITVEKPGYETVQRLIDVAGGDETDLELTLQKRVARPQPATAPEPKPKRQPTEDDDEASTTPFWVTLAFTLAAGVGTAAMGAMALQAKADFDDELDTYGTDQSTLESKREAVSTFAAGADVLGVVTASAAVVTVVFAVRAYAGSEGEPEAALIVGPTTIGLSGRF